MRQKKSSPGQIDPDWFAKVSLSILQAGLILAAAVTPLFMVPHYTTEPFELGKAALLRMLAPLLLSVWAILLIKIRSLSAMGLSRLLLLPVVGYVLASLLATLFSIAPQISLWGSHIRSFGTLTTLAAVTLFLAGSCGLRRGVLLNQVVSAMLIGSVPVSLYTLLQVFRIDPLSQAVEVVTATSFLGNPNFIAAYLIMVIPVTCSVLVLEFRRGGSTVTAGAARLLLVSGLLCLQAAALWFSRGQGAVLGLLAGMVLFVLLLVILTRRLQVVVAMAGAVGLGGILLFLSGSPLIPWLQHKLSSETASQRLVIWRSVEHLLFASPARLLVGHGPETLYMTLNPYYPPEEISTRVLGGATLWDRAHNTLLDTAAGTGLLGVATSLWVTGAFLLEGLAGLGIVRKARHVCVALGGGAVAGALGLPLLLGSWGAAPLGLAVGLLLGLFLFLIGKGIRPSPASVDQPAPAPHQLLLVGLLAALVAHFTEVQFGFELAPTYLAFWVYGGMISAIVNGIGQPAKEEPKKRRSNDIQEPRNRAWRSWLPVSPLVQALLVGAILGTVAFSLGLQELDIGKTWSGVTILLGSVWLAGSFIATLWPPAALSGELPLSKRFPIVLLGSLAWGAAYLPGHLWVLRAEPVPTHLIVPFALYLLVTAGLLAGLIFVSSPSGGAPSASPGLLWLLPLLLVLGIWSAYRIGVVPMIAESYARAGFLAMKDKQADASVVLIQRAVDLQPQRDRYLSLLADAYLQKAKVSFPPEPWLRESESLFLKAARMTPVDPDHLYNLGTLHLMWAALIQPWGEWRDHLESSITYYLRAVKLGSPQHRAAVRDRLTRVFTLLGLSPEKAAQEVERRLPPPTNRWKP